LDALTNALVQTETLISKVSVNGDKSASGNAASNGDLFSTDNLQASNDIEAENYTIVSDALKDELNPSTAAKKDQEAAENYYRRARAIESAQGILDFMRRMLYANGIPADSTMTDFRGELRRLRHCLQSERENLLITLTPYLLWTEEIGPTLQVRQQLERIRSRNNELQGPNLKGLMINMSSGFGGIDNPKGGEKGSQRQKEDFFKKTRRELEQRRAAAPLNNGRSDEQ